MSKQKSNMNNIGPAHFKSIIKQQRNNNYNLIKVLNEFIDNIIKKCKIINIKTMLNDNKLYEIKISDNYEKGFENINEKGSKNPFNMGHIRDGQDDDDETSEFGIGMKGAAIASANKFIVYTRVRDKYYKIFFDFVKMSNISDIIESYNPIISNITEEEYKDYHNYDYGSTLILEDIRDEIYSKTTDELITNDIMKELGSIFGKIIKKYNVEIKINNKMINTEYDFFEDEKCKLFTQTSKLYYLYNDTQKIKLFLIKQYSGKYNNYYLYSEKDKILEKDSNGLEYYLDHKYKCLYSITEDNKECLQIDSTFTFFVDKKKGDEKLTHDNVEIYKDDRRYSNLPLKRRNNGAHNYTLHKISFNSKNIGKQLGMTYNKEILLSNNNNDLINCIEKIIDNNRKNFSADTSTDKFTKLKTLYDQNFITENITKKIEDFENQIDNINENNKISKQTFPIKQTKQLNPTKQIKKVKANIKSPENINDNDINEDIDKLNYFYIIQTPGKKDTNIYKIGKTSREPLQRLREYEKGYKTYLILYTNSDKFEDSAINCLIEKQFTQVKELGKEWFSGDINEIIKTIFELYSDNF
jgi:hypothetical protein